MKSDNPRQNLTLLDLFFLHLIHHPTSPQRRDDFRYKKERKSLENYDKLNCEWGFPGGSVVKNPSANTKDTRLIPGLGRSPAEGNGNPFHILAWKIL